MPLKKARLLACLFCSALLGPLLPAQSATARARPNFVFFLVDDLGWKDLGCFGSTFYETPQIDRLARGGMRFTSAYAACCVCSPTRASILAGKYPARMNTTDYFGGRRKKKLLPADYVDRLPHEEVTIAEALKEAGYATAFAGKWHLGREPFTPESQGFDVNFGGFWRGHPPAGYFSPYKNPKLADGPKGEYLTDRLTDEAVRWLDTKKGQPFLLYFSFYNVHTPLQAKQPLIRKYENKRAALPPPAGPRWIQEGTRKCRQVQDHATYAAMVQAVDDSVGRVLEKIDEMGATDNTVVILFSDNGGLSTSEGHPTANVPLRAGKGWNYEGGIREPMIVRWPGKTAAGSVCDTPVISTDFYPTMLEMAGLPLRPAQHVDGKSLVPLLRGRGDFAREALYWHYPHYGNQGGSPSGAIRVGDWKLIEWFEDGRGELFDLAHDVGETRDLAADQADMAAELRARLRRWRQQVDARMPRPNPDWKGDRRGPQEKKRVRKQRKPNILWITCEDVSPHLGCYGDPDAITPNLDRLARQGVRYTHAFAPIGVCAPARSCLITGMYPNSIGTHHMRCQGKLPQGLRCFPEYLRHAGYYCSNNVKTDYNFRHPRGTWDESSRKAHWRKRADGQPFFSVFNFTITHESQIRAPDERFARRTQRLGADERRDPAAIRIPPYHPDTPLVRRDWARYHELVTVMDKQVDDLLRQLRADGLEQDTIVFFFSDHGAGMPRSKRWLYDSSTRVPMIVRFGSNVAGAQPGARVSKRLVSFVDFAPTVLSLAGVEIPPHMQGEPFLGAAATAPRRYVYGFRDRMDERYDMLRSVRDARFKYIRNFLPHVPYAQHIAYNADMPTWQEWRRLARTAQLRGPERLFWARRKPKEELYDTLADPHEVTNLAGDGDYAPVLQRLRRETRRWMLAIRDLGLLPESDLRSRFGGEPEYDAVRRDPALYPLARILAAADRIEDEAIQNDVSALLADEDPAIRWWTLTALEAQGEAPAVRIREMLHDHAASVRLAAASLVCRLGGVEDAMQVLRESLQSDNHWVRLRGLNLADRLDDRARPLLPLMRASLRHRDRQISKVAKKAIADLGG